MKQTIGRQGKRKTQTDKCAMRSTWAKHIDNLVVLVNNKMGTSSFWLCYIRAQPTVTAKHKNCGWLCGYSHMGTNLEVKAKPQWHQETSTAKHINSKTKRHQNTAIANPSDIKIQWQQIRVIRWLYGYNQMRTVLVVKANASDIKTHQQPKPSFMKTQWQQNRRD